MKKRLAHNLMQKLSELGQAIDIDRQAIVFDGGEVGIVKNLNEKDIGHESEGTRGSAAGSREGPEPGSWGASGEAPRVGQLDEQELRIPGVNAVKAAYPTVIKQGDRGLWIIVTSKPLGNDGPQVTFALAYPDEAQIEPRAWGLWKLGDFPKIIGPRHTNFPDASICAVGSDDNAWSRADGPIGLVDLYSTWVVRQLYFQNFGRWPGRQYGATPLYRRTEFNSDEWCGCNSGRRYKACHEAEDKLPSDEEAREHHHRILGSYYGPRRPPKSLIRFIRSGWSRVPSFVDVYQNR